MKHTLVSIVIPLYNERPSLRELALLMQKAFAKRPWSVEYVFVDDGSTDGSFDELKSIRTTMKGPVTIVRFRKNCGKSMALSEGFRMAKGEVVVTLDADLQDDPGEIHKLVDMLDQGYDLVVGWRKRRNDAHNKIRLSRIFNGVVSRLTHVPLHDMNCGMKAMRRSVTREVDVYGELHRFIPVLAAAKGFKVGEVEIVHHARKYGVSKFGSGRIMRAAFDLLTTLFLTQFRTRPLQIFGPVGLVTVVIGLILLLYLSVLHFMGQSIGDRPLLLLGILFVLFGVQLVSTGLVGELVTKSTIQKEIHPVEEVIV